MRHRLTSEAVAHFFGLRGAEPVAKDFAVLRSFGALAALDAAPFTLVFAAATAFGRAQKPIRRMSEDVDFKIMPTPTAPVDSQRSGLPALRDRVTSALQATGLAFD